MTKRKSTDEAAFGLVDYVIDGKSITFYGPIKLGTLSAVLATLQRQYPAMMDFNVHMKPIKPQGLHTRSMI